MKNFQVHVNPMLFNCEHRYTLMEIFIILRLILARHRIGFHKLGIEKKYWFNIDKSEKIVVVMTGKKMSIKSMCLLTIQGMKRLDYLIILDVKNFYLLLQLVVYNFDCYILTSLFIVLVL